MSSCLSEQQLRDLAAGQVDPEQAALWKTHIETCHICHEVFDEWVQNLQYAHELQDCLSPSSSVSIPSLRVSELMNFSHETSKPEDDVKDSIPGYQIIREIHRGGQGIVYLAVQESTKRKVAVKVLLEGPFAGPRSRWRFEREVKLVAALNHPNIVTIHDSGLAQGRHFYAMDYVRGLPLDDYMRFKSPSVRDTMLLFAQICEGMSHAHRRGVIHRDLKPSNVLVTDEGVPYIVDFGLAKVFDVKAGTVLATESGNLLGTLRYMAPEQTGGNPDAIDTRTDVYALGVVLYELLTDSPPYETGADLATAVKSILKVDPVRPSKRHKGLDGDLDAIVLKAMDKDPRRRYGTASELAQDVSAWLEGRPIAARSDSSFYVLYKLAYRHGFETAVIVSLLLAIGGFGTVALEAYWWGQGALAQKAQSDRATVTSNNELNLHLEKSGQVARTESLGWFLAEWQAGRTARAAQIQAALQPDSSESKAMAFLLDDSATLEQLLSKLPIEDRPLAYFVGGERACKHGRVQEALAYFDRCMQSPGNGWMKPAAKARLEQLRQDSGDGKASVSPH